MNITEHTFGFRVLGSATEARRLIDWASAFRAYADCDARAECGREAYLSAFTFAGDFAEYLSTTGTTKGFAGSCCAPWLWFDVDNVQIGAALDDARRLATALTETCGIAEADLLTFYSGSKGFHFGLPTVLWMPEPGPMFHRVARRFAERIAERAGVIVDTRVYDRVRLFRAPNSRHPKTGRHKRRLTFDELMGLSPEGILHLAEVPEPFELPEPTRTSAASAAEWQAAAESIQADAEAKAARVVSHASPERLNRLTLDTIRNAEPIPVGERHARLFSAAANLRELACPAELAHALLTETGLDCGLPPSEVRRQIDCGLAHVAGGAA